MGPQNGENDQKIDAGATGNRQKVQKSRILGGKFEEEKKVEKKRAELIASEGPAVAVGRIWMGIWMGRGWDLARPWPILGDGRAD